MTQTVTCWRCGSDRVTGPTWCATCQAPEKAWPGVHQTYKGPLTVQGDPHKAVWEDRSTRRRNMWLALVAAAILLAVVTWIQVAAQ